MRISNSALGASSMRRTWVTRSSRAAWSARASRPLRGAPSSTRSPANWALATGADGSKTVAGVFALLIGLLTTELPLNVGLLLLLESGEKTPGLEARGKVRVGGCDGGGLATIGDREAIGTNVDDPIALLPAAAISSGEAGVGIARNRSGASNVKLGRGVEPINGKGTANAYDEAVPAPASPSSRGPSGMRGISCTRSMSASGVLLESSGMLSAMNDASVFD